MNGLVDLNNLNKQGTDLSGEGANKEFLELNQGLLAYGNLLDMRNLLGVDGNHLKTTDAIQQMAGDQII